MSYEILFITKGGVTLDIPFCDSRTTLMTSTSLHITLYITYDYLHSTNDTWNFTYNMFTKTQFPHIPIWDKNRLESAKQDKTKTQMVVERPTHQPPLCDPR